MIRIYVYAVLHLDDQCETFWFSFAAHLSTLSLPLRSVFFRASVLVCVCIRSVFFLA